MVLTYDLSDMAGKRIAERQSRHKASEESLLPGQSLVIEQRGGRRIELKRIDPGFVDFNQQMDRIFQEIPVQGKRVKTN